MKKGFTLIELLAVIFILGLILLIIMPSIVDILNRTKTKLNDEQISQIENAARNWGLTNVVIDEYGNISPESVTIEELQNSGYLEDGEIKDLFDKSSIDPSEAKVCISFYDNQYIYEYRSSGDC